MKKESIAVHFARIGGQSDPFELALIELRNGNRYYDPVKTL